MLVAAQTATPPHRTFTFSTDPDFEAKLLDIVGLYLNPPENALVLCVDEKPSIPALDRTPPLLPLRAKKPRAWTNQYVRHGHANPVGRAGGRHRQGGGACAGAKDNRRLLELPG
jgi:hypothetical protein